MTSRSMAQSLAGSILASVHRPRPPLSCGRYHQARKQSLMAECVEVELLLPPPPMLLPPSERHSRPTFCFSVPATATGGGGADGTAERRASPWHGASLRPELRSMAMVAHVDVVAWLRQHLAAVFNGIPTVRGGEAEVAPSRGCTAARRGNQLCFG
jgi:hypothetical protein